MKKREIPPLTVKEFFGQLFQRVDVGAVVIFILALTFAALIFIAAMRALHIHSPGELTV